MTHSQEDIKRIMADYHAKGGRSSRPVSTHKNCRRCGEPFKKSRTDSTVNCPRCRAEARER